jgi:hypothetical protein
MRIQMRLLRNFLVGCVVFSSSVFCQAVTTQTLVYGPNQIAEIVQAAANNWACTIHLSAGLYLFNQSIVINKSNITIEGEGRDVTVLLFGNASNIVDIGICITRPGRETCIKDLSIYGPSPVHRATVSNYSARDYTWSRDNTYATDWSWAAWRMPWNTTSDTRSGHMGILNYASWVTIKNVKIMSWWGGIVFGNWVPPRNGADDGLVENCAILSCYTGVYIAGPANDQICIKNNWIAHNGGYGINISRDNLTTGANGPAIIKIQNNKIGMNGLAGIHVGCALGMLIEGNYMDGNVWRRTGPEVKSVVSEIEFGDKSSDASSLYNVSVRDNYFDLTYVSSTIVDSCWKKDCFGYQIPFDPYRGDTKCSKSLIYGWATSVEESRNCWRASNNSYSPSNTSVRKNGHLNKEFEINGSTLYWYQ